MLLLVLLTVCMWVPTTAANLGGVFSLCMGISVISLIEIVYFLGIRVRHHYVQDRQKRAHQLSRATKDVVQVLQLTKATAQTTTMGYSVPLNGTTATADGSSVEPRQLPLPSQQRIVMMTRPEGGWNRSEH